MTSRERLLAALAHIQTDRPPVDFAATTVTGLHAHACDNLRKALGLHGKVWVYEMLQQLGYVDIELRQKMGSDVIGTIPYTNSIGVRNYPLKFKDYPIPGGGDGLCIEGFNYTIQSDGTRLAYPQGDVTATPSYRMPPDGYYFDAIDRSTTTIDDETEARDDFADTFVEMSDEEAEYYRRHTHQLRHETDFGVVCNFNVASLGDPAKLPGANIKSPKGIRNVEEWLMAHVLRPEYVDEVNKMQTESALKSIRKLYQAVGDNIDVLFLSGTDFGTQRGLFISREHFLKFYKPYFKLLNDWVHQNTGWKVMYHSCGAISELLEDFIEMGVDIVNPVQCSAEGMEPEFLKEKFGDRLVFWGGGVDTQKTLPFGTAEQCRKEVRERINIFGKNGGYVFNAIHNIQAPTPVENIIAIFDEAAKIN